MLPLYTKRLMLRAFTKADIDIFVAYRNDPDIARYQSWKNYSHAEARALLESQHDQQPGTPGQWYQIAIADRDSNQLIGDCALHIHSHEPHQATIGITFGQSSQGQGFAREALTKLFDHLFSHTPIRRITADVDPRNTNSWALLEKLGMRREGHLIKSLWFKGSWVDEYLYAILREEWQGM